MKPVHTRVLRCYVGVIDVTVPIAGEVTVDIPGYMTPYMGQWLRLHCTTDAAHMVIMSTERYAVDTRGDVWIRLSGQRFTSQGLAAGSYSYTFTLETYVSVEAPT